MLTFFTDFGFHQLVNEATREANILDLLCCNDPLLISDFAVVMPFSSCDHDALEFTLIFESGSATASRSTQQESARFMWNKSDWDSFANYLHNVDWDVSLSANSVDDIWARFVDVVSNGIVNSVPTFSCSRKS